MENCPIKSLNNVKNVAKYLDISGTLIETLPENLTVFTLILNGKCQLKEFPKSLVVVHNIQGNVDFIRNIKGSKRYNIVSYD